VVCSDLECIDEIISLKIYSLLSLIFLLSACLVAKLETRLEDNPQCKDVVNPKTGALMPCPRSDKTFYREVGLAPALLVESKITDS
jgi:hypothetical protein